MDTDTNMSVFKNYFFHDLTRKYQLVFGTLFKDMEIKRYKSNGKVDKIFTVPVINSPKEKFVQRLIGDVDPDTDGENMTRRRTAMAIPAISYEMTDIAYDSSRKVGKNHYLRLKPGEDGANRIYTPAPYTLTFEVHIITRTQDEMYQIIEQIIPAFQPDVNITVKGIDGANYDVPINFTGLFRTDSYDGTFDARRQILWTLNFTMKAFYFAPLEQKKIILDVTADVFRMNGEDLDEATLIETFHVDKDDLIGKWIDADD